ncbi:MAG: isocitrate lyase/phosphoenolpyruvate mutase family protein [Kineosporiaceae bacterium]
MTTGVVAGRRERFAGLHVAGCFVLPNAWDVGSARILASLGFPAIATTSSGHAHALGRLDQHVSVDELLDHVSALVAAVDVPVSVDAEDGFADDADGVARLVHALAERGAAGLSLEDYRPGRGLLPPGEAVERVAAAADAARAHGLTLTARAENHLYGVTDLDDTVERLVAYRDAGADVLYAPGLADHDMIRRVVAAVGAPVNVLLLPDGPTVSELTAAGVRRVSTGGWLARTAYGALARAARELRDEGTAGFLDGMLTAEDRSAAFDARHE